jgi:hypothetical protein
MKSESQFDRWENWAFEDDERLLLGLSRVLLTLALVAILAIGVFWVFFSVVNAIGPVPLFVVAGIFLLKWIAWTLTGGRKS